MKNKKRLSALLLACFLVYVSLLIPVSAASFDEFVFTSSDVKNTFIYDGVLPDGYYSVLLSESSDIVHASDFPVLISFVPSDDGSSSCSFQVKYIHPGSGHLFYFDYVATLTSFTTLELLDQTVAFDHVVLVPYTPPSVLSSVLGVFVHVASWLPGSLSDLVPLFYSAESGLTFVGVLAVAGLSFVLILLVFIVVRGFLLFRG